MSWLSKTAKKVETNVSRVATKAGVGKDLKKAANIFGAVNVGGAVGIATGFLTGGAPGAIYGAGAGGITAGIAKYKGESSSKFISNAAGNAAIAGAVGPLIYKPGAAALISAPGPVSAYGPSTIVKTANGGVLGSILGGVKNTIGDALTYIGKGGLTAVASNGLVSLFGGKRDNALSPNPDYQQGNAVPPGGTFPQWLTNVLPGKSYDPTAPSGGGTAGGGGANPITNVDVAGSSAGLDGGLLGGSSDIGKYALYAALGLGGFLLFKKGGLLRHG